MVSLNVNGAWMPYSHENVILNEFPSLEQDSVIQVNDASDGFKYISRFIGIDGRVIITRLPAVTQLVKSGMATDELTYRDTFNSRRKLVMRLISNGRIYAFETEVIDLFLQGARLLMTSYPDKIQSRWLRKEPRYPCAITAELVVADELLSGIMINFSSGGGLLKLTNDQGFSVLQQARSEQSECILKLQLPFNEKPVDVHVKIMSLSLAEHQVGLAFSADREIIVRYITALKLESVGEFF
ncbi:flagellar brake domain-containing protein [Amphritea sp. 1_MG-2023]|uniref:PilZ domain-containing protein n=1 Tax=Amphritea sp. 1_MG-2023 TaxID=3062670 RepID=UPI0026E1FFD4|nr:PilZ domain-containing protein [Amphritea sp. 1_MG-2023]MDO6564563.1 flagellar brake domain-containing protein [Amphritea sp. 1_MG-2023]